MKNIKTIDELSLMDDYMFAQVMRNARYLKPLLEYILQIKIEKIKFSNCRRPRRKATHQRESASMFMLKMKREVSTT